MFPGFVHMYKDSDKFVHLYFFPGIDKSGKAIYKNIDMSECVYKYTETHNSDNSIDIKFDNKKIIKIHCKLVSTKDNSEHIEVLTL